MAWPKKSPASGIPASGIPAGGPGLHGPARGGKAKPFSTEHQVAPEAKKAGHEVRRLFRAKLAEKLEKVAEVYDAALADPDLRVGLVAAKQISVELWGQPTQPVSGDENGGPLTVVVRRLVEDEPPA